MAQPEYGRGRHERGDDELSPDPQSIDEATRHESAGKGHESHRQEGQSGLQRRVVLDVLEVERDEEVTAEDHRADGGRLDVG